MLTYFYGSPPIVISPPRSYHTNDCQQSVELMVDRMQIDNCLYNTPYPIMLWPVLPPNMKALQVALVQSKEWKTITFIRYLSSRHCLRVHVLVMWWRLYLRCLRSDDVILVCRMFYV